nr:hypothetical protein [Tanacetum cinerariifolium]
EKEEPFGDDADEEDDEQDKDDDDEEEEHPASADSIPPPPALRVTARISFRPQPPTLYETGESSVAAATKPIEGRRADYGFVDSVEAQIRRRRAEDIGYGIRDTWIDPRDVAEEEALTTLEGVNTWVTELAAVQEQDTQDIYGVLDDTHGLSSTVHFELQGYMTHTWVQDQRIDAQDTLIATLTTQLSSLHGHLATALGEIRELQAKEQARAGKEGCATWDGGNSTWGGRERGWVLFKMETVFRISNCLAENQVKFATCTLLAGALTWWNSHIRIVGNDAVYVMT